MNASTFNRRRAGLLAAATLALSAWALPARAAWPDKPINIVVPYAPGGTADALARLIAQHLGPKLNTTAIVVNRAGASGVIGQSSVAQAAADGYTVLYDATPYSINPHLQKMPYDPDRDLQPLALVAVTPMLALVPKASPYNSLQDLLAAARLAPRRITFASGGQGTVQYMGAELMAQGAQAPMLHIPYKSGGPALSALIGGEIDMGFFNLPAVTAHVKSGALRPLAITSATRNSAYPDVPTVQELVIKGYDVQEWNGVFAPAGVPADIVAKLNTALREVLTLPEVKARFDALGSRIVASSAEDFRKFLVNENTRWGNTVKAAGIKKE